ncbi:unnamed protein product [Phytophthora fragariaefolia]|uniref:Unnamed protein product n=1 Tax=Phytophthora fragariaefolia TaxID=1490495 RepID=A0A9W6YC03_9STRA|nr:unnamed protein product [Phytophthora fragariaefolia]
MLAYQASSSESSGDSSSPSGSGSSSSVSDSDVICDCRSASQGAVGASQGAPTQQHSTTTLSADTSSSDPLYPPSSLQHIQQHDAPPPFNNPAVPLQVYCPAVPLLDIAAGVSADRRAMVQRRTVAEAADRSPVLHFPEAYCVSYPSVSTYLNSFPATARKSCDQTKRRRH